ncbi:MAG TPA: CxxxxCH/CxxCH domain-containing protein [Ignavibacteriaceae bacterium]|nr:CxxxxCH/CxxCH domain-containing protein [Ignavibacteriaceae bacterium]
MKVKLFYLIFITIIGAVFVGCSDLKNNISPAPELIIHKSGILDPNSPNYHVNLVKENNWNMRLCQQCHGGDFAGGTVNKSCLNCHTEENGPLACNTCHGDPAPGGHIYPPFDLAGDTSTTAPGVGAHPAHLLTNNLSGDIRCSNCHKFPQGFFDPAHISSDGLPAQITFGRIAVTNRGVNSKFDYNNYTCSNIYCHGNFVAKRDTSLYQYIYEDSTGAPSDSMYGNNVTVTWNRVDGTQAKCGSCHGLPPTGHRYQTWPSSCVICHVGVIDDQGNIIDSTKHINGKVDVFEN